MNEVGNDALEFRFDPSSNRAFRYGDGLFETIRISKGQPLFVKDHFRRLSAGLSLLGMSRGPFDDIAGFMKVISGYINDHSLEQARLRLQVYRLGSGFYTPVSDQYGWVIDAAPLPSHLFDSGEGLSVNEYHLQEKAPGGLSGIKSTSALLYVSAAHWAKTNQADDAIVFNTKGNPVESSKSNLFVVRQGKVLTPPLSEGCIDGIMRMQVIDILSSDGSAFFEMPLSTEDLESADEIWLTNVVQGVAFARKFRERSYSGEWASRITEKLNQKFTG